MSMPSAALSLAVRWLKRAVRFAVPGFIDVDAVVAVAVGGDAVEGGFDVAASSCEHWVYGIPCRPKGFSDSMSISSVAIRPNSVERVSRRPAKRISLKE